MPICSYCLKPIQPGEDRATIDGPDYHSSCFDRHQQQERRGGAGALTRMDLTAVTVKLSAGVLPQARDVAVRFVRYASGVCVACDLIFGASDVGVQFDVDGRRRLLHVDCYVMWIEACT